MTAENPRTRAAQELTQAEQAFERADYPLALDLYRSAVEHYTQALGAEHQETANALSGVGKALNALGEYAEARPTVEQALAIQRRGPGPMRPEAIASQHLLGEIMSNLGNLAAGERLLDAAYRARRSALGVDHPDALDSLTLWGALLFRLGKPEEAEPPLVEGARRSLRALGDAHRVTGRALLRLGLFYAGSERTYPQARQTYERALEVNRAAFGPQHPFTGLTMNNLAALLANLGETERAHDLFRLSLALHEAVYGRQHPLTAFVLFNLGDVNTRLGDHPAAFTHLARAWTVWMRTLGLRHAQTMSALHKLVVAAGRLEQEDGDPTPGAFGMGLHICLMALQAAGNTLDPANRALPGVHLDPARAETRLEAWTGRLEAWLSRPPLSPVQWMELETARRQVQESVQLEQRGDYPAAQAMLQSAFALQQRVLGDEHLAHAALLSRLAALAQETGESQAVLPLLERSVALHDRLLGPEHPLSLLAFSTYVQRYDYEYGRRAALPRYRELVDRHAEAYGAEDPITHQAQATFDALLTQTVAGESAVEPTVPRASRSERSVQALAALPPERQRLHDGIERIDWRSLRHAYGPAVNTPDMLRKLLAADPEVRDEGWQDLYSSIWHQGTVYEASAAVVPFLLRLLAAEPPPEKTDLLTFLSALATGSSYLEAHALRSQMAVDWNETLARQGRGDLETELLRERAWVQAANDAVAAGIPLYLELLERGEPEVQKRAVYTLACLPRYAANIFPDLLRRLPRVQDPLLRLALVRALRSLMDAGPEAQRVFTLLLQTQEGWPVRFEAAAARIERLGEGTLEADVNSLLDAWRRLRAAPADLDLADAWPLEPQEDDLRVLLSLGLERGSRALFQALGAVDEPKLALDIAGVLLDLVFNQGRYQEKPASVDQGQGDHRETLKVNYYLAAGSPPERQAVALTEAQRRVLKTLLEHPAVWRAEHNLLTLYGLPSDRKSLRRILS